MLTSLVLVGGAFVAQAINDGEGGDGEVRQGLMIRGTAQPPLYSSVCTYSTVQGGSVTRGLLSLLVYWQLSSLLKSK